MQVYLVRHAEAVDETLALRDPLRHLTATGRDQAKALGDRMRWHDAGPTHAFTSPLVRAVQTGELVLGVIDNKTPLQCLPALAPDGAARDVLRVLQALPADAEVMLVGHEPSLSAIGALLVNDRAFEPLAKAEAVRLDGNRIRWRFAWDAEAPATRPAREP